MYRLHGVIECPQECRIQAVVVTSNLSVIAIHCQQILRQVITTNTKEINLFAALIDDEHHRRHFQHDAELDLLIKRNMFIAQLLFGFRQFFFHP